MAYLVYAAKYESHKLARRKMLLQIGKAAFSFQHNRPQKQNAKVCE